MQISFSGYDRCLKNFSPLEISLRYVKSDGRRRYDIFKKGKGQVGRFRMMKTDNELYISDFFLKKKVRNKKTSADAIISMKNFIQKFSDGHDLSFVEFFSVNNERIKKLYQKLGGIILQDKGDEIIYFIPIQKSQEYLKKEREMIFAKILKSIEKSGILIHAKEEIPFKPAPIESFLPFK